MAHEISVPSGIDFETLNDETASNGWLRYARSKLANVLFGQDLARRLAEEKVCVNIVHPGPLVDMPATSPEIEEKDIRDKYFIPVANQIQPNPFANDMALQTRLWDYS
ncbi:hypothetical protein BGZ73_007174 [Actinomortierella ambigua]|nr:hypothetical protein BGZ73_007174 [Actinomortierella ambigua]